ncbi:hypothetical protein CMI37_04070 [Candidatus Pacearchaeota archaeon]|nr:hypothetical protein [Candidatus Pacearchaeota archaeon]
MNDYLQARKGYTDMFNRFRRSISRSRVRKSVTRELGDNEMITVALKSLRGYNTRHWKRITLDNKYWFCSKDHFQKIVDYNTLNEKKYALDQFDCDNFAFAFKSQVAMNHNLNNVGMVIDNSGGHAYNVVIFNDMSASLFEPQTDQWITPGQSKMYSFKNGIIIL